MAAHSEESEIYRCNDPRQRGAAKYFPSPGGKTYVSEIGKEKCVEKRARLSARRDRDEEKEGEVEQQVK